MTPNLRGALFMMGSMVSFTVNDAFMKSLSGSLPLAQAIFLRGIATTLGLVLLVHLMGQGLWPRLTGRDRWLIMARNLAEVATAYFFLTALFNMPLANATAILQALPLTVTFAGALFLGQAVGWRRFLAIGIGFFGVMLIVRPGMDGFTIYSVYALIAVVLVTIRDILSRMISGQVGSVTVALSTSIWVTVAFGLATIGQDWQPVDTSSALAVGRGGDQHHRRPMSLPWPPCARATSRRSRRSVIPALWRR